MSRWRAPTAVAMTTIIMVALAGGVVGEGPSLPPPPVDQLVELEIDFPLDEVEFEVKRYNETVITIYGNVTLTANDLPPMEVYLSINATDYNKTASINPSVMEFASSGTQEYTVQVHIFGLEENRSFRIEAEAYYPSGFFVHRAYVDTDDVLVVLHPLTDPDWRPKKDPPKEWELTGPHYIIVIVAAAVVLAVVVIVALVLRIRRRRRKGKGNKKVERKGKRKGMGRARPGQ